MPAKDIVHDRVKTALINDGWTITHDPFRIRLGRLRGFIDLGAERPIAAEKAGRQIAVEIKGFIGLSLMDDLEKALGQYGLYATLLANVEPERQLFLAVSETVYADVFDTFEGRVLIKSLGLKLVVVNMDTQEVTLWIV